MDAPRITTRSWVGAATLTAAVLALAVQPAHAAIQTWTLTGTLNGNTVVPDPILVDGVPGTTANLNAAGIVAGVAFSATLTWDTATPELLGELGIPGPDVGIYPTGGFNWTLGGLSARTAHGNQAMTLVRNIDVSDPNSPPSFLDLLILGGGDPPSWNGTANNLEVRTVPLDPNVPGDIGTAPTVILAMFPGTLVNNTLSGWTGAPNPPFLILDKGFGIPLLDTGTGQNIQLSGSLALVAGGGTIPTCASGDTDSDTICNDVDLCPVNYDIGQSDRDGSGIGNACNDAFDADGDEYEDAFDNCPNEFDPLNSCLLIPALPGTAYVVLAGLLLLLSIGRVIRHRPQAPR